MKKRGFIVVLVILILSLSIVDATNVLTLKDFLNKFKETFFDDNKITTLALAPGQCKEGSRRCYDLYSYQICQSVAIGNVTWGPSINCNFDQFCSNGQCIDTKEGCVQPSCNPQNSKQYCNRGAWLDCSNGYICNSGQCIKNCVEECSPYGKKECLTQTGYKVCGNFDSDVCFEWSTQKSCGQDKVCTNNQCISENECISECSLNQKVCSGKGYKECVEIIPGCFRYSTITECNQGEICLNGRCNKKTGNEEVCVDRTTFNECSIEKPLYCDNGDLIEDCVTCGCENDKFCLEDGSCGIDNQPNQILEEENNPPIIKEIETIEINKKGTIDLDLDNYIEDEETVMVNFKNNENEFESELINCVIKNNILTCSNPKKSKGEITIDLIAKDSLNKVDFSVKVFVINRNPHSPIIKIEKETTTYANTKVILDASKSYDEDDDFLEYIWYENEIEIGKGVNLKIKYDQIGKYNIKLKVLDEEGMFSEGDININIVDKPRCGDTKTVYFPKDTICTKKWPSKEGESLKINSREDSCDLFEICSDEVDYIIEDAIDCCDGNQLVEDKKVDSCKFANDYGNENAKKCQALYMIKSLGASQIYMQDYFEAEMCCAGVNSICGDENNLYTSNPIPNTEENLSNIQCFNTKLNNPSGYWISDRYLEKNNIALFDAPAHVSLNKLSTGTCTDYSTALTTLLRKIDYKKNEVYTITTDDHAYNAIKLPLDKKYTLFDTTGNNEPPIVLGNVPYGYDYCEKIKHCYNDVGEFTCPSLNEINGCEEIK